MLTEVVDRPTVAPSTPNAIDQLASSAVPLRPIEISGVVVRKAALITALQIYVPQLQDLRVFEGGDYFLLELAPEPGDEPGSDRGG